MTGRSPLLGGLVAEERRARPLLVARGEERGGALEAAARGEEPRRPRGAGPEAELHRTSSQSSQDTGLSVDQEQALEKHVKRLIVEAVAFEFGKVGGMISEAIGRRYGGLQAKVEILEQDLALLRAERGVRVTGWSTAAAGVAPEEPGGGPSCSAELGALAEALERRQAAMEEQVSQLWENMPAMKETLELAQLRNRLQTIATGMLALTAADLSEEDRWRSMQALQEEEATLKERARARGADSRPGTGLLRLAPEPRAQSPASSTACGPCGGPPAAGSQGGPSIGTDASGVAGGPRAGAGVPPPACARQNGGVT